MDLKHARPALQVTVGWAAALCAAPPSLPPSLYPLLKGPHLALPALPTARLVCAAQGTCQRRGGGGWGGWGGGASSGPPIPPIPPTPPAGSAHLSARPPHVFRRGADLRRHTGHVRLSSWHAWPSGPPSRWSPSSSPPCSPRPPPPPPPFPPLPAAVAADSSCRFLLSPCRLLHARALRRTVHRQPAASSAPCMPPHQPWRLSCLIPCPTATWGLMAVFSLRIYPRNGVFPWQHKGWHRGTKPGLPDWVTSWVKRCLTEGWAA